MHLSHRLVWLVALAIGLHGHWPSHAGAMAGPGLPADICTASGAPVALPADAPRVPDPAAEHRLKHCLLYCGVFHASAANDLRFGLPLPPATAGAAAPDAAAVLAVRLYSGTSRHARAPPAHTA